MNSNRERKAKAWLALLLTTVVLFLISTFFVFRDCYIFFAQVDEIMFSTDIFLEERVASTSSIYTFVDVNDSLINIGVRSTVCSVDVSPLITVYSVSYGRCSRDLEDVGAMETLFCEVYTNTILDWFFR